MTVEQATQEIQAKIEAWKNGAPTFAEGEVVSPELKRELLKLHENLLKRQGLTHHYRYVRPGEVPERTRAIGEATVQVLKDSFYRDVDLRWILPSDMEGREFSRDESILGIYDLRDGHVAIRADAPEHKVISTILHESEHAVQLGRHGREGMQEKMSDYWHNEHLEHQADDFANSKRGFVVGQVRMMCQFVG